MEQALSDRDLRRVFAAAGDLGEAARRGSPVADLEPRLRAWHAQPPEPVEIRGAALDGEQVKTLVIDALRLAELRALRADRSLQRIPREHASRIQGGSVAVITGAGISVDAGFRTFRGAAGEGHWEREDPMVLASVEGFHRSPMRTLRWYCSRRARGLRAVPTLAHAAAAAAQAELGTRWAGMHTQNVDGLHEVAGNRGVNRIHGSIWVWRHRETCELVFQPSDDVLDVPKSPDGQPAVRPGVVMFGDMVPGGVYERSIAQLQRADAVVVVGTSAQVSTLWPLLHAARRRAHVLIEVNPEASPVTEQLGALHVALPAGVGLPLVLEELGALRPETTDRLARTPRPPLRTRIGELADELLADA